MTALCLSQRNCLDCPPSLHLPAVPTSQALALPYSDLRRSHHRWQCRVLPASACLYLFPSLDRSNHWSVAPLIKHAPVLEQAGSPGPKVFLTMACAGVISVGMIARVLG